VCEQKPLHTEHLPTKDRRVLGLVSAALRQ
jgi:hypothetical protein